MQLTIEQVNEMLSNYREYSARVALIERELDSLRDLYADMLQTAAEDSVSTTSVLTGMPRGTTTSDPTGRLGIDLAAGRVPPHLQYLADDIKTLSKERSEKLHTILRVDALLQALNEKQEFVLRHKAIDQMQWREIIFGYKKLYEIEYSRQGIKKIYKASLERLYKVAGCSGKIKK